MPSGPQPKRVVCPTCQAPQGLACVDVQTRKPCKPHPARAQAAKTWYVTTSPDGLTPMRRDEMVEALRSRSRGGIGPLMEKITRAEDSEKEFKKVLTRLS